MDTIKLIDELEALVEDSKNFMGMTMGLDREEFFALTDKLKASLPDEVRKASRITAEGDRILNGARESAEQMLMDAQQEAARVQQAAQAASERLTRDSESKAQQRIQEADATAARIVTDAQEKGARLAEDAQGQADRTVLEAHQRAEQLVSDSEILRRADQQAREIRGAAEYEAQELRRGADEYARGEMVRIEKILTDSLLTVQRGRIKLDQRLGHGDSPGVAQRSGRNGETASRR